MTAISEREPAFAKGSVGRPIGATGETRVSVVDGELVVNGPSVMLGYLDDPDATRQVLRTDGLHTGDRGRVDDEGYVYVEGRLERAGEGGGRAGERGRSGRGAARGGGRDGCVCGGDPRRAHRRAIGGVRRRGEPGALKVWVRERLPPAKRPRIEPVVELPRTANGKHDLSALRARAERP